MSVTLRDPQTKLEVTYEETVSLSRAVGDLANLIAKEKGIPPHEVLFSSPPFEIVSEET